MSWALVQWDNMAKGLKHWGIVSITVGWWKTPAAPKGMAFPILNSDCFSEYIHATLNWSDPAVVPVCLCWVVLAGVSSKSLAPPGDVRDWTCDLLHATHMLFHWTTCVIQSVSAPAIHPCTSKPQQRTSNGCVVPSATSHAHHADAPRRREVGFLRPFLPSQWCIKALEQEHRKSSFGQAFRTQL